MANKRILVIGSANMDLSLNMYKLPEAGETLIDDGGVAYIPGGKGANSAVAFSKLGSRAVLATKLGADLHGQKLYEYYKSLGIDTGFIKVDRENPTGFSAVLKESGGATRVIAYPGANSNLSIENIAEAIDSRPDAVYISFEMPFNMVVSTAKMAAAKNIPVFVDASPSNKDYPLESLPPVEIFSPNEAETYEYTGILPQGTESCLKAALALYRRVKAKYIVIKQGERGSFVYDGHTRYNFVPAMRVGKVVDPTSAGDAFTAALTIAYLDNGGDIHAALKYATCAAALTVTKRGGSSSIPSKEEVDTTLSSGVFY